MRRATTQPHLSRKRGRTNRQVGRSRDHRRVRRIAVGVDHTNNSPPPSAASFRRLSSFAASPSTAIRTASASDQLPSPTQPSTFCERAPIVRTARTQPTPKPASIDETGGTETAELFVREVDPTELGQGRARPCARPRRHPRRQWPGTRRGRRPSAPCRRRPHSRPVPRTAAPRPARCPRPRR
jgi:hypothetical protein